MREGDDLHYEVKISLCDALCGFTHDIVMLDEKERIKRLKKRVPVSNLTTQVIGEVLHSPLDCTRRIFQRFLMRVI